MTTYTIKKGEKEFSPISLKPIWFWVGRTLRFKFILTESCWFWTDNDGDIDDWNKGTGITSYWGANNENAIMWAWRPLKERNLFEICVYRNDNNRGWYVSGQAVINANKEMEMVVKRIKRKQIRVEFGTSSSTIPFTRSLIFKSISPYIGGADNEPGDYNSTAVQNMIIIAK